MARISPFAALRFNETLSGESKAICCPPYDIIPVERQNELEAENPYNVIRLERPLGQDRYRRAGALLRRWCDDGVLKRDSCPAYYVYRLEFEDGGTRRSLHGFFARVGLEPFSSGVIMPHEETISKDKSDRYSLMEQTLCNISPVYGLYEGGGRYPDEALRRIINGALPDVSFTDGDSVTHSLWVVSDPGIQESLTGALADKRILIADGHHRYETALAFFGDRKNRKEGMPKESPCGTVLMFLADIHHPDLVVWPTHRLVREIEGFRWENLVSALEAEFQVATRPYNPGIPALLSKMPRTIGLYMGGDAVTLLTLKDPDAVRRRLPDKSDAYCSLEVSMLHACILEPHLGIGREKLAAGSHIDYTRDIGEAHAKVRAGACRCAFLLPPTDVGMIGRVADQGERMPQKSTYFHPKLTTGLVIHPLY